MQRQQHGHGPRPAKRIQDQARGAHGPQQQHKGHLAAPDQRCAQRPVRARFQPGQPGRSQTQQQATGPAQQLGQAQRLIGCLHAKAVVQHGAAGRGRKAQQKAVKRRLMAVPPRLREAVFVLEVAAVAMPAVQVRHPTRGAAGLENVRHPQIAAPDRAPIAAQRHRHRTKRQQEGRGEHGHHQPVRHVGVEARAALWAKRLCQRKNQRKGQHQRPCRHCAAPVE